MSNRSKIINAFVDLFNSKLNGIDYSSNIYRKAIPKLKFWDEINQYPHISIVAGQEYREYLPANFKWGFLQIKIYIYVKNEESMEQIEQFLEDIETILDANNNLSYDTNKTIEEISILSIDTDEGLLSPVGAGEIQIQIRYDL